MDNNLMGVRNLDLDQDLDQNQYINLGEYIISRKHYDYVIYQFENGFTSGVLFSSNEERLIEEIDKFRLSSENYLRYPTNHSKYSDIP